MKRSFVAGSVCGAAWVLAACGSSKSPSQADAGTIPIILPIVLPDASASNGYDAGRGRDAGVDDAGGGDVDAENGTDAGLGTDAGGGIEAGVGFDAGAGFDAGGGFDAAVPTLLTTCSLSTVQYGICDCTVSGPPGATPAESGLGQCGNGNPSNAGQRPDLCCASSDFPSSGDCTCYQVPQPWGCGAESGDSTSCYCGFGPAPYLGYPAVPACNNAAGEDGNPWVCCFDAGGKTCQCTEENGFTVDCPAGEQVVSDCTSTSTLGLSAGAGGLSTCPDGTTSVDNCYYTGPTTTPECSTDAECSGGCDGNCCVICSAGQCVPFCS